jgi:membrane fusion protein (multidrug efflux system)
MKGCRVWILIAGLVAGGATLTGCASNDSRADEPPGKESAKEGDPKTGEAKKKDEAIPVEVIELEEGSIEAVLRYSTNLEAEEEVQVFAEAARQVERLLVEEGAEVQKGQLLVKLRDEEQKTALAKARTQHDKARREFERQQHLFRQDLISEQAMNEATFELERLTLEVEEAARALSYTEVRAPIAGTVTHRMVGIGDYVTVHQHLFDIVDFRSLVARIYVPEKELTRLSRGQQVRVTSPALGAERFAGTVDRVAPVVDPRSGTVKVTVALPDTRDLLPGMYVDVELVAAVRDEAVLVPKRALVYDDDQIFLFRVQGEGEDAKVERVRVVPQLEDKLHIEPEGGLAAGDRIVIAGQAGLKDGAKVRPVAGRDLTAAAAPPQVAE